MCSWYLVPGLGFILVFGGIVVGSAHLVVLRIEYALSDYCLFRVIGCSYQGLMFI